MQVVLSTFSHKVLSVLFVVFQDILNNLDPPGTGELDDDDLMLDVDLPEDGLLHGQHTQTHKDTTLSVISVFLHTI